MQETYDESAHGTNQSAEKSIQSNFENGPGMRFQHEHIANHCPSTPIMVIVFPTAGSRGEIRRDGQQGNTSRKLDRKVDVRRCFDGMEKL